jgi:hypothetical protein
MVFLKQSIFDQSKENNENRNFNRKYEKHKSLMLAIGSKTPSLSLCNTLYINNASQVLQLMIKLNFCIQL